MTEAIVQNPFHYCEKDFKQWLLAFTKSVVAIFACYNWLP